MSHIIQDTRGDHTLKYDVVVAGGSIAGLLCAREAARAGCSVLVLEKSHEIGTPQHCGGLLSRDALDRMGVVPSTSFTGNTISGARLHSPGGIKVDVPVTDRILEIDRRGLDRYVAEQAQRAGATIRTSVSFRRMEGMTAVTTMGDIETGVLADARGIQIHARSPHALPAAQCEIHARWIRRGTVEVMLDQRRWPGFFAWIIPSKDGAGKVGVAGRGINPHQTLHQLLAQRGGYSVLRLVASPVWVGGPVASFVQDRTLIVGDAAGQTKPTTGGGIYSGGMGGILAGQAAARYLQDGIPNQLDYAREWQRIFGPEFSTQLTIRRILERLDNAAIDRIVAAIRTDHIREVSGGDFDFHASSILDLLGIRGMMSTAVAITSSELRRLVRL